MRNITPALDQPLAGSVFCRPVTSAITAPSQLKLWLAKLHWSLVPQMSAPPPEIVHAPLFTDADPASDGAPMSVSLQPGGKPALAGRKPAAKSISASGTE